jgi:hypothetical protein
LQLSAKAPFFRNPAGGEELGLNAHWESSDPAIAKMVTAQTGAVQGIKPGSVKILARLGPFIGVTTMTVIPTASQTGLTVSPKTPNVPKGATQHFAAIAQFSDGSSVDVSSAASWGSSNTSVAIMIAPGLAKAMASSGSANISVSFGGFSDTATLVDVPPIPQSLTVYPSNPSVPLGLQQQFSAIVTLTDSSIENQTNSSTWTSSAAVIATISSTGLASTLSIGQTTIQATYAPASGPVTGQTTLSVTPAVLLSIAITPSTPAVQTGKTLALTATGTYTNGPQDITNAVTWQSSNPALATVNASGAVSGVAPGSVTVTATLGSVSQSVNVTVFAPLSISTGGLANGNAGIKYIQTLAATGGLPGYSWSLTSGSLPAGMMLSPAGLLAGTTTMTGSFAFTVQVTDQEIPPAQATMSFTLFVGNTYFVDSVGGNDNNTGQSTSQAWQSLAKVSSGNYSPGDLIALKAGDVWNQPSLFNNVSNGMQITSAGAAGRPISLGSYGDGSPPVIDGLNELTYDIVLNEAGYMNIGNLTVRGAIGYGVDILNSPNVTVHDCSFQNIANAAINVGDGSPNVLIDHNSFTEGNGITSLAGLVRFYSASSDNPVVSNNSVGDIGSHFGINIVDALNARIFGNTVTGNGHSITIEANTHAVTGGQIYDNVTSDCSVLEGDGECIGALGTSSFPVSVAVYRNVVVGGPSTLNGISGFFNSNSQIYENLVLNIPLGAAFHYTMNSRNNVFYNNSAYNANTYGFGFFSGSSGNVVKNNIVKLVSGIGIGGGVGIGADNASLPVTEDFNILNQVNGSVVSPNLTQGTHTVISDPGFVSGVPQAPNDFKLAPGSPAIDSGVNLGAPFNQGLDPNSVAVPYSTIDQNQFGSGWERGAFVYRP